MVAAETPLLEWSGVEWSRVEWSGMEWLEITQNHQNRPTRPHNRPFQPQNWLQRMFLTAIASSTASGVICGLISGHKKRFNLGQMGGLPPFVKLERLFVAGNRATEHPRSCRRSNRAQQKYAGADSEVEKACCEAWGVDFDDFCDFPGIGVYTHFFFSDS